MSKLKQFLLLALLWIVTYVIFHYVGWALYHFGFQQWRMGNKGLLWFLVHILQFPTPDRFGYVSGPEQGYVEILLMIYAFILAIGVHVLILKKLRKKEKEFKGYICAS